MYCLPKLDDVFFTRREDTIEMGGLTRQYQNLPEGVLRERKIGGFVEPSQTDSASIPAMSEALALRREMVPAKPQGDSENDGHLDRTESSLGQTVVIWEFWKVSQSEFRYRPVGVVELGNVDAEVVDYAPILARLA